MLQFPSENSQSHDNAFIMTPVKFIITTKKITATQKLSHVPATSESVVLPTPNSGLFLNETGNWDESTGYQHARSFSGIKDLAIKGAAHQFKEQSGAFGNVLIKGEFINDYASLSYQGSNFREFSFSWLLIPTSEDEAVKLMNIIKQIRYYSLPNYGRTNNKGFIQYPYMWEVNPAVDSKIDMTIKDSVITNFTVNYTPEGVLKTYNSGHPISVDISITFKEIYRASDGDVVGYNGRRKG
jgi:hypothetical protein